MEVSAADPARPAESQHGPELVARIRAGDPNAEEELVQHYRRGVFAILSHSVADKSVVEDLSQETFRITLEKVRRGDVREPEKLSGFVCSVARNLAIEHFRHGSIGDRSGALDMAGRIFDPGPSPLQEVLRREKAAIVRQVLKGVKPARYRGILYRYYLAEEDKERICADLGMESLQFNRVLHRARESYRKLYERMVKQKEPDSWDKRAR
jgi:RNA polymerase sigma-70 factor (ECF subfamily)